MASSATAMIKYLVDLLEKRQAPANNNYIQVRTRCLYVFAFTQLDNAFFDVFFVKFECNPLPPLQFTLKLLFTTEIFVKHRAEVCKLHSFVYMSANLLSFLLFLVCLCLAVVIVFLCFIDTSI